MRGTLGIARLETLLVVALAAGLGIALLEEVSRPFAALFMVLAGACLYTAVRRGGAWRWVAYNIGVVFLGLALVEAYFIFDSPRVNCDPELSDPHEILGYAPLPARRVSCGMKHRGEAVYDATYTLDNAGWRILPPHSSEARGCALFFGGSFTFGQGVDDEEAMPYRVGVESGGGYQIYNFGFKGYGPHQMLAALESKWVEAQIACEPSHVIYQALAAHVRRAVGLTSWGSHAPKYRLGTQGGVVRAGRFDDSQSATRKFLERRLQRSALITRVRNTAKPPKPAHIELFHRIVAAAKIDVEKRFPGAEFHVLMWDLGAEALVEELEARGVKVHRVSNMLPGLRKDGSPYRVHPKDAHPSAKAHALIAQYVVEEILLTRNRP